MKEAWGRWGESDEIGALNLVGPEVTRQAALLVKHGTVFSLAQPISPQMAIPKQRPGVMHFMGRDGGDYATGQRRPGGFQYADDTLVMPMHAGTHLDALCHCWYDDALYNGFAATEVRSSGALRCGVDRMPPIATRGVLLDFVRIAGAPLEDGHVIGVDMVREAIARSGTTLCAGDAVLLRTGWLERQDQQAAVDFYAEPGIDVDAALLLAEAGVAVVGADNFSVEVLPFAEGTVFPVHQRLIRDFGIPLLEGLVLKPLGEARATSFMFVAAPLPIEGATGSPLNPLAIL